MKEKTVPRSVYPAWIDWLVMLQCRFLVGKHMKASWRELMHVLYNQTLQFIAWLSFGA